MVRLKAIESKTGITEEIIFNSKVVRLKEGIQGETGLQGADFQFQSGTIKGLLNGRRAFSEKLFNSKVVRLKASKRL